MNHFIFLFSLWSGLLLPGSALAQDTPLFVQGGFEDATVSGNAYNAGGVICVNGFHMNIPENLLVHFPEALVPWGEFVARKEDFEGFETRVVGNTVDGEPRVAQVVVDEFFDGLASGFVESIDSAKGTMQIQNGPVVRINDPNGMFSVGYTGAPFMGADDVNPTIISFSGFPMCIPRSDDDSLCPSSNRPFNGPGNFTVPDPLVMAPFLPGDFITFKGFRKGDEVIATRIVAENVQVLIDGDLVYLRVDPGIVSVYSPNIARVVDETEFMGFTSNSNASVAFLAMDIDPCTGETTDRLLGAIKLGGGANEQNTFEIDTTLFSNYTREYKVIAEIDGIPKTQETKNGLIAGQYILTVNDWVQAVQTMPGVPPVPFDFSQMGHLTQGVGLDSDGNLWGPLRPFPQSDVVIKAPDCAGDYKGEHRVTQA